MQLLERVHLVQFFLFEAQTLRLDPTSAIIAPNGAGKSALLDALQIVLLGGDRSRIRFNAQAGGSHRARSIRDYCLGVFRSGDGGRKRRTATTYISLVFRDQDSGVPLTAGIALGASIDEPDHRQHGLYLFPGVALELEDHLERINGKDLPLEWSRFRELGAARCREAGTRTELHTTSERFVRDLLLHLRASPTPHADVGAYRKAFQNALNLQRVEDVDLFVRTLVAEDRPTDIARFRALLDSFRQIKEKIEQVRQRIEAAEVVERKYERVAAQAVRAASYRALQAEYRRDLLGEQIEQAETTLAKTTEQLASRQRELIQAREERDTLREEYEHTQARLHGNQGYGEQARFDELATRDHERLARLHQELLRDMSQVRSQLQSLDGLKLAQLDTTTLRASLESWNQHCETLVDQPAEQALPWSPEILHEQARHLLATARPLIDAANAHARERHTALDKARERLRAARENQKRLESGQAELHPDTLRLMAYLRDEGIDAVPVCDLIQVRDARWQPAIEAYLRNNLEALLIPLPQEQQAVRLYRSLSGGRAIYGVKLALSSQTRNGRAMDRPASNSVAALLESENNDALAFIRRQLGELACVESEAELIASSRGLTRDGMLSRGGSTERLRLPAANELKIGAKDNRSRARALRSDLDAATAEVRQLDGEVQQIDAFVHGLARLASPDAIADALHERALEHTTLHRRYHLALENRAAALDPDLLRLSTQVTHLKDAYNAADKRIERLIGDERETTNARDSMVILLDGLRGQEELAARAATEAFAREDVDHALVERSRSSLDDKFQTLEERARRCEERARDSDGQLTNLLPDAWSALTQYAHDHHLSPDFAPEQWRPARTLLQRELAQLRDTELVQYEQDARQAYDTAVETFRSNVVATLYENFEKLKLQINTLNRTLRQSPAFSNNERYQFHYEVLPEFRELQRFIQRAADVGSEDNLFGSAGEVPAAFRELIEHDSGTRTGASPLDDYRRFFRFEVKIRQEDRDIGTLSERMRSGSGGEHRAPLYVIAGAALAAAYGKSAATPGGMGLILLDEFGDKIDAQNARATTNYLRSLGLQLVLAAPDTAQGTLSGVLDSYIELFRDGDLLQVERIEVKDAARDLLLSDGFDLHPELLADEIARIQAQQSTQ